MMATRRTEEEIRAIVARCAAIEKENGDVLAYLRSENYVSPGGTWFNLQREYLGRKRTEVTSGKPVRKERMDGKVKKITTADKAERFVAWIEGGMTKQEALKKLGCAGPREAGQQFRQIKAYLQEHDPVTYDAMMERLERKGGSETAQAEPRIDPEAENAMLEDALASAARREMIEACAMPVYGLEPAPAKEEKIRMRVTSLRTDLANYEYLGNDQDPDEEIGVSIYGLNYREGHGEADFRLYAEQLEQLVKELPVVIRKFREGL